MIDDFIIISVIFFLGAASPGPSLVIILNQTITNGAYNGYASSFMHSIVVGIYALLSATGLGILTSLLPKIYFFAKYIGGAYLLWLGINGLLKHKDNRNKRINMIKNPYLDGLIIAIINPKIFIFFLALFSQIINIETTWNLKITYSSIAMFIDMMWYFSIVYIVSNTISYKWINIHYQKINFIFSILLIIFSLIIFMSNYQ